MVLGHIQPCGSIPLPHPGHRRGDGGQEPILLGREGGGGGVAAQTPLQHIADPLLTRDGERRAVRFVRKSLKKYVTNTETEFQFDCETSAKPNRPTRIQHGGPTDRQTDRHLHL